MSEVDLTIIIPCYNEEESITECVMAVPEDVPYTYEILVVDGGSKDKTSQVANALKKKGLRVIRYEQPRSKGYACAYGVDRAKGKFVVIQDVDMTPADIPNIVKPLFDGTADFVNGTRMLSQMEKGAMSRFNKWGNKIFAILLSLAIKKRITDSLCGYKAFPTEFFKGKLVEDNWPDFEMLIKAKRFGLRIVEVPIKYYVARKHGEVKMKPIQHGWSMLKMYFKLVFSS